MLEYDSDEEAPGPHCPSGPLSPTHPGVSATAQPVCALTSPLHCLTSVSHPTPGQLQWPVLDHHAPSSSLQVTIQTASLTKPLVFVTWKLPDIFTNSRVNVFLASHEILKPYRCL